MHLMYNFHLTILVPSKHHTGIEAVCSSLESLKNDVIPYKYALSCPSNAVNISVYYISDPDLFTGGEFKYECIISSEGPVWNLTGCPMDSSRLIDGVTGEGSSPLNTDQFVGWDSQSHGTTFIIVPQNSHADVPPRQVDIYFHNNPAMGIGLPPIAMLDVAYQTPGNAQSIGPLRFTYANNQHLIQSNNDDTTLISVVFTTRLCRCTGFPASFSFFCGYILISLQPLSVGLALISEIESVH